MTPSFARFLISGALAFSIPMQSSLACTSLLYTNGTGEHYAGRTFEYPLEVPYQIRYLPTGTQFESEADGHAPLKYTSNYAYVAITTAIPEILSPKVLDGMNEKGLTFSMLAFSSTEGPVDNVAKTQAALAAIDLGSWTLSQFATVQEVKKALHEQDVLVTALLPLGQMKSPFHYSLHDASGASIVIEFSNGTQKVYDNPVGVMTNGPDLPWHLTNLNNYTFLNNLDTSTGSFNGQAFTQPDSGIATVALPSSNTSVGRFVKAVYYSQYAEKVKEQKDSLLTLSHVMNNFDRPRGITIDLRTQSKGLDLVAPSVNGNPNHISEYTSWTRMADLKRGQYYVRTYYGLNYVKFDLPTLMKQNQPKTLNLETVANSGKLDVTAELIAAK